MKRKTSFLFTLVLCLVSINLLAQPAGDKQINPYHQHYADSLKAMDYKPIFPLLGRKAYKKGFDIPLPYGVGMNYFYMKQNIDITNTKIGFNGNDPVDLSGTLKYGNVVNTTNIVTFRPDLWVLPFLNVYGVFGYGKSNVVVPISAIGNQPLDFSTTQHFGVSSLGFGATLAGGIGPVFLTIDNNINWAKVTAVDRAVAAYNLDARIGHNFISPRNPQQGITIWIGAFMQTLRSKTVGHIAMSDIMSQQQADDIKQRIENSDLTPIQKSVLVSGLDKIQSSTVESELDKKISAPWNMIFGAQYQYNKHWQARLELGTFGQRSQCMLSLNYRFQ